ncbi:hypothetical protein PYJP_15020 [Pyrofollis japonicus]|nr:hypothetical protein PYJP_15020 [Pyrofollis japonicus]
MAREIRELVSTNTIVIDVSDNMSENQLMLNDDAMAAILKANPRSLEDALMSSALAARSMSDAIAKISEITVASLSRISGNPPCVYS